MKTAQPQPAAAKRGATPPPSKPKPIVQDQKPTSQPKPSGAEVKAHGEIFGLHPQAFAAAVAIPVILIAFCIAIGPARPYSAAVIGWVVTSWKAISSPIEAFLIKWSGTLILAFALVAFSPFAYAGLVLCFRAANDLDNQLTSWQKVMVLTPVWIALGTLGLMRKRVIYPLLTWTKASWTYISLPLEKWLTNHAGSLVIMCLTLLCVAAIAYAIRKKLRELGGYLSAYNVKGK